MTLFFKVILANYRLSELSKGPSGAKPVSCLPVQCSDKEKNPSQDLRVVAFYLYCSSFIVQQSFLDNCDVRGPGCGTGDGKRSEIQFLPSSRS